MAHVLITGASSGLGEHLALELVRRGHAVSLLARRRDALDALAARITADGGRCAVAAADVTDASATADAIARCVEALGPVDIAVANAGGGGPVSADGFDLARATALLRLNIDGVLHTFAPVLPAMLARGSGQIVAVSSIAAWRGLPGGGLYSAAKAAVSTLMEAWSAELRHRGVAVTTIHPGFVRTPLTAKNKFSMPFLLEPDDAARRIADGIEARRRSVNFPAPMVLLMAVVRRLPAGLFEWLTRRAGLVRSPRGSTGPVSPE